MIAEPDFDLTPDQWETLKAVRGANLAGKGLNRFVLEQLVALNLAELRDGKPALTPMGRTVLVRGSSRLLDLVA